MFSASTGGSAQMQQSPQTLYFNGYTVDDHGNIRVPILGEVNVLGFTTDEVRQKIEKQLLEEYFRKNRPQAVWHIGDRVFGHWNKIPFVGTVGNDNMINELEGPRVSIFLDIPIKYNDKVHNVIFVKQKAIKRLKDFSDN